MKLFVYPQKKNGESKNPYIYNMEQTLSLSFEIVHKDFKHHYPQPLRFLLQSGKADVYVLSWLESSYWGKGGALRAIASLLGLLIIHFRKCKIVWIFHNIHPHEGENFWTKHTQKLLFKWSTFIIAHSKEAAEYAKKYSACQVYYRCHPLIPHNYPNIEEKVAECDFLIWGNIFPYKGVLEFISNPLCKKTGVRILIKGKCDDEVLRKQIEEQATENILFENRSLCFDELASQINKSKYVVFPYVGESISSSGVLIDTIQMGGVPVGPKRGAFSDLAEQGCCITYDNISEVFNLPLDDNERLRLNEFQVKDFLRNNTWEAMGKWMYEVINNA